MCQGCVITLHQARLTFSNNKKSTREFLVNHGISLEQSTAKIVVFNAPIDLINTNDIAIHSPKFPKPEKEMWFLLKFIIKCAKFFILNRPTKLYKTGVL